MSMIVVFNMIAGEKHGENMGQAVSWNKESSEDQDPPAASPAIMEDILYSFRDGLGS